jgi:sRNA-binding carbon storage regulator CsrA
MKLVMPARRVDDGIVVGDELEIVVTKITRDDVVLAVTDVELNGRLRTDRQPVTLWSGESHRLSDTVVMTLVELRSDRVRFEFDLPASLGLHLKEVYEDMRKRGRGRGRS